MNRVGLFVKYLNVYCHQIKAKREKLLQKRISSCIDRFEDNHAISLVLQILIASLMVHIFFNWVFELPYNRKIQGGGAAVSFILSYILLKRKLGKFDYILICYTGLLIVWGFSTVGPDWINNRYIYFAVIALSLSFLMIYGLVSPWTLRIPFIILCLFILYSIFIGNESVADSRFFLMSRNSLPMVAFSYAALISIHDYIRGKQRPQLWPPLLTFLISFLSQSRAGLVVAILYALLVLVLNIRCLGQSSYKGKQFESPTWVKVVMIALVLCAFAIVVVQAVRNSRFMERGFSSSGRTAIYRSFFDELTMYKAITGFRPEILDDYGHLHNSFLQLLSLAGIASIPVFAIVAVSLHRLLRQSFLLFGILVILCIYSLVEYVMFFRIGDFALFPLLLIANSMWKPSVNTVSNRSTPVEP